jgi:hypothetical protein
MITIGNFPIMADVHLMGNISPIIGAPHVANSKLFKVYHLLKFKARKGRREK